MKQDTWADLTGNWRVLESTVNAPRKPQETLQATERWIEVLAPSYRIQAPSRPSQRVPAWVQRLGLNAKDLTVHHDK
jgi:hypothetical protein